MPAQLPSRQIRPGPAFNWRRSSKLDLSQNPRSWEIRGDLTQVLDTNQLSAPSGVISFELLEDDRQENGIRLIDLKFCAGNIAPTVLSKRIDRGEPKKEIEPSGPADHTSPQARPVRRHHQARPRVGYRKPSFRHSHQFHSAGSHRRRSLQRD